MGKEAERKVQNTIPPVALKNKSGMFVSSKIRECNPTSSFSKSTKGPEGEESPGEERQEGLGFPKAFCKPGFS